jgi:predicted P-loop ATPase
MSAALPPEHVAAVQKRALDYAAQHDLKLFPINPETRTGSLYSAHGDRAKWEAAFAAGMQLGVSAIGSDCLLFDVDVYGREDHEEAWRHYCALCEELKITAAPPYAHSKSGGWHVAFRAPPWFKNEIRKGHHKFKVSHFRSMNTGEVDKERVSIRWRALNVFAGSVSGGGVYQLTENAPPPHPYGPATAALFDWYAGLAIGQGSVTTAPPTDECTQSDVECAKLERFVRELMLREPGWFEDRDNRLGTVWGIKRAGFGHRGYEIAAIICDVTADEKGNRLDRYWNDSGANRGTLTLDSFWKKCWSVGIKQTPHEIAEWKGNKIMAAFGEQAAALANRPGAAPMIGGAAAAIIDIGLPRIAQFNATHADIAHDAEADSLLPHDMHAAELRGPLTEAIGKVLTLAKTRRHALQFETVRPVFAVLAAAHEMTYDAVVARVRATGAKLPDGSLKIAVRSFEGDVQQATRTGQGWVTNSKGYPDSMVSENVDVLLSMLSTETRYNEFAQCVEFSRNGEPWRPLKSQDVSSLHYEANSATHRFHATKSFIQTCVETIARRRTVDPVVDYLNSLKWDGVPRLGTWLTQACGVPADAYHAAVGRNVIGGMVKRARSPGAKHDEILLLIGEQGGTKSGLPRALLPEPTWFSDSLCLKNNPTNLIPEISGKWLIEWSELAGKSTREIEDIKAFISRQTDRYTAKFENIAGDHPRRMIFIATSNDDSPLRDETGNRRFLPARVTRIDTAWIEQNRDQLFAEASALYEAGERFGIPENLWGVAGEHQEAARETPLHEDLIVAWFGSKKGLAYYVTAADLTEALNRKGCRGKPKVGAACKRVGLSQARANSVSRYWVTEGGDYASVPRLQLKEPKFGVDRSKIEWEFERMPPPSAKVA